MVDAQPDSRKHRWRGKLSEKFQKLDKSSYEDAPINDPRLKSQNENDVNAFLAPSKQKAQENQQQIATNYGNNRKPKIDVAAAQRWPGAHDIGNSPSVGGLPSSMRSADGKPRRKLNLTVTFARTAPEIIGTGGDESLTPTIEVLRRKGTGEFVSDTPESHQDDINLGLRSDKYSGLRGEPYPKGDQSQRPNDGLKRSLTSHGELSPPLRQRMEMGNIVSNASPPPPPQRLGPMGLGERPKPLARAPTGFDVQQHSSEEAGRPSLDSTLSFESSEGGFSPIDQRKPTLPNIEPTIKEEDDFVPKPLKRTQTGWSEHMADSDEEEPPRLPELKDEYSPLDMKKYFLESEPQDPNSYSARIIHKMHAEEGRAFHQGAKHPSNSDDRSRADSVSTNTSSFVGSPPQPYSFSERMGTPSRVDMQQRAVESSPTRKQQLKAPIPSPLPSPGLSQPAPRRSHARGPSSDSITRKALPLGSPLLNTEFRPDSSSSKTGTPPQPPPHRSPLPETALEPPSASTVASWKVQPTPKSAYGNSPSYFPLTDHKEAIRQDPGMHVVPPMKQDYGMHPVPHQNQDPGMHPIPQRNQDPGMQVASPMRQDPGMQLARSDTRSQGDAAYVDFSDRVTHMKGIFRLTAEMERPLYDHTPMQWLRVAIWWFLRGRAGMEGIIRSRPKGDGLAQPEKLTQPHVDLAKTWWILTEVIPNHPGLRIYGDRTMATQARAAREARDMQMAEIYDVYDSILGYLKLLMGSVKKNQVMPPTQALIQGQDQTMWIRYPNFAPDAQAALSGKSSKSLVQDGSNQVNMNAASLLPLSDTKLDFCYFRMFVQTSLSTDDADNDRVTMPCVLSVLRPREELAVKLSICSQTELVNICVQSNPKLGPTWEDVKWRVKSRGMYIRLSRGYTLSIEFTEQDFRTLWAVVEHTNKVGDSLRPREDERIAYDLTLRDFQYKDPTSPQAFPAERVKGSRTIIFEKREKNLEGSGKRMMHRGYRMLVVTNPKNRTLSCVKHDLGQRDPIDFEFQSDQDGAPAMVLRIKDATPDKKPKVCNMFLVFNDPKERNVLFGTLTSMNTSPSETIFAQVPLKSFIIEDADQAEGFSHSGKDLFRNLQWTDIKTLNLDPEASNLDAPQTVQSENLRVIARHASGCIIDRMNMGSGELILRLPTSGNAEMEILRQPQADFSAAVDTKRSGPSLPEALAELMRMLGISTTLRTVTFHKLEDLHSFQHAITGFGVRFDGIAATLSISRRRMVVPIYKQWTAHTIRLQVVVQDTIVQLLAFFTDFSHADAMNFVLKPQDVFEKNDKGGSGAKYCVRLVDAKFALPVEERKGEGKMGKEEGREKGWAGVRRRFVCLDEPEYPGEHDDIVLGFETAEVRDQFVEALPAATSMGRKMTLRRKI